MIGVKVSSGRVLPEWIDVNQHMNVAYYTLVFDLAIDALWESFGITEEHIKNVNSSTFAVESHLVYLRELNLNDPFVVTAQILAYDQKRIHQFQRLYHAIDGQLAATAEWMNLHVDLESRRVAPWPDEIMSQLATVADAQGDWPWPDDVGRRMRVREPVYSADGYGDSEA